MQLFSWMCSIPLAMAARSVEVNAASIVYGTTPLGQWYLCKVNIITFFSSYFTHVNLERPFLGWGFSLASVSAPSSSFSSMTRSSFEVPLAKKGGSIISSEVSLVGGALSCRPRWKSAGPKGRPGSEVFFWDVAIF